jgi:hypothetical protein
MWAVTRLPPLRRCRTGHCGSMGVGVSGGVKGVVRTRSRGIGGFVSLFRMARLFSSDPGGQMSLLLRFPSACPDELPLGERSGGFTLHLYPLIYERRVSCGQAVFLGRAVLMQGRRVRLLFPDICGICLLTSLSFFTGRGICRNAKG